jgi:hypothetical protein
MLPVLYPFIYSPNLFRRFNDYMETILAGKEKAFKGGGYDTGAFEALKDIPDDELLNKLGE